MREAENIQFRFLMSWKRKKTVFGAIIAFSVLLIFTIVKVPWKKAEVEVIQIQKQTRKQTNSENIQWCSKLHFIESENKQVTALASFPGSGNTWLRYLLQQATGVYTGSVYKEKLRLAEGISGETRNSSVLVVKSHRYQMHDLKLFDKAIVLIRSPEKAILAEYNRRIVDKTGEAKRSDFTSTRKKRGCFENFRSIFKLKNR